MRGLVGLSLVAALLGSAIPASVGTDVPREPETAIADAGVQTYIVQFESPAPPAYTGSIDGLSPTATNGRPLALESPELAAYRRHLADEQADGLVAIEEQVSREVELLATYDLALNGVAIELTADEAVEAATLPEVANIEPEQVYGLESDAGPEHIGAATIWDGDFGGAEDGYRGEGAVVGVLDTGISPENPSFAEEGPVDGYVHSWDGDYFGVCDPSNEDQYDESFPCNDKLVGAWYFTSTSARDQDGHGSHTASVAAGNLVEAELDELDGEATVESSGVAPHAHIISYRVCGPAGCTMSAILSALNQAINDGVDVVNYSIGGPDPSVNLWSDANNVAWLNANAAGIRIAHSAGNNGPGRATVGTSSDLPWVTSVGAGEHNRAIQNELLDIVGDDDTLPPVIGKGLTSGLESGTPVVYDHGNPYCEADQFVVDVEGAVVLCDRDASVPRVDASVNVDDAGGGGFVLMNDSGDFNTLNGEGFALPGVHIGHGAAETLKAFVEDNSEVTAGIRGHEFNMDSPWTDQLAGFSSRGPNRAVSSLVPSLTAPGIDIIGAQDDAAGGAEHWGLMSGTSASAAHISGAYALLAGVRPDWSHAAAQSALQLTARQNTPKEDGMTVGDAHSEGSGYANVGSAVGAGFVLDIANQEYWGADPHAGGDVRDLNTADLVDYEASSSTTWTKTLTSTQGTDVTWSLSGEADDLNLTFDPTEVTIPANGDAEVTITAAIAPGTPEGLDLFGRVGFTTDEDLPDASMPVAMTTTHAPGDLTVDPDEIFATQNPDEITEHTVTISNRGSETREWEAVAEGSGAIWSQPSRGSSGVPSNHFNQDGAGVYAADDFEVGEGATLSQIRIEGYWIEGDVSNATDLTWMVYPDADGMPAGHPEDGQDAHIWANQSAPYADGVTIDDNDLTLNLEASGADELVLEEGRYWLTVFPSIDQSANLFDRWSWHNAASKLNSAHVVDEDELLYNGAAAWTPLQELGLDSDGLAFSLQGDFACSLPSEFDWLDMSVSEGSLSPGESQNVEIAFDASGFSGEEVTATVCIGSGEPGQPVTSLSLGVEVGELVSVVVEPSEAQLVVGDATELGATAFFGDGTSVDVTGRADWVSEDEGVVTVDAGEVTGIAEGGTDVTATYEDESGSASVTVSEDDVPPPEDPVDVVVTPDEDTVGVDGVVQFEATAIYDDDQSVNVTGEAEWASGDEDVATVDDAGSVTGVAEGDTEVTATFEDLSDSATVTVDAEIEPGPEGLERISAEPGRVEVAIAASEHRFGDGEANAVVLARADEYPDALAGTTLAAEHDAPLLLTSSDELLGNVSDELSRVLGDDGAVYLTGGTAALDETVEDAVDELGYDLTRVGGETRFETAGLIADELGERSQVLVTTGLDFPDALTAGAAAAAHDGVVLLSADDDAHDVVDEYLDGFEGEVTAVGGPATRAYPDAEAVMGETRDETAVAVAEAFFEEPVAFGVARRDDYPDALSGGAHIAAYEGPLLLSYTEDVPEETAGWLAETEATGGFVYGGTAAVDEDTFDELEDVAFGEEPANDD